MNDFFLKRAYENEPQLLYSRVTAPKHGTLLPAQGFWGYKFEEEEAKPFLRTGDSFCLDFGDHYTGRLSFRMGYVNVYPDAPVCLHLKFAETLQELGADFDTVSTGLCRSWLQQETTYIDAPGEIRLPRRYAFRYLQVTVIATSQAVTLTDFAITAETCADMSAVKPLNTGDPRLIQLDRIGLKTTAECMQRVFEDGPKRDRRLWLGDLRVEGLVNYHSFRNMEIVKKCLYLFASLTEPGKRMPACLFENGNNAIISHCFLLDYALFFGVSLNEYHLYSGDDATVDELFEVADGQFRLAESELDENGIIIRDPNAWWCFIDHNEGLQKTAAAQAVIIYSAEHMRQLSCRTGRSEAEKYYEDLIRRLRTAAMKHLYDPADNVFRSEYDANQLSVHAQIWMILADVLPKEKATALLERTLKDESMLQPISPYMHHFVVEAMVHLGLTEMARQDVEEYWGAMADRGADTYWEINKPSEATISSHYGADPAINSFCHGWSCSATYFIRKYFCGQ